MGRWAWSSDAWDFDHDGYPDLYIANGYISGPDPRNVSSFFWRQVVGNSPQNSNPSANYEQGWNAINELIRSDSSWAGPERNVFYANNRDGTFSEVSGAVGMDFPDDSRTFVLADLDHDGRLEVILKNRNAPQLRVLRNAMKDIGHAIAFRLRGQKSNRDAIGSAVMVEAGTLRQTKYLQAGSGFLSQHSKELFFGLGKGEGPVRATVRWPSGLTQTFENLPVNRRIEIQEGANDFQAKPFAASPASYAHAGDRSKIGALAISVETWLIEPLSAPDFSLPDFAGKSWDLRSFRGSFVLLNFWSTASPSCASSCGYSASADRHSPPAAFASLASMWTIPATHKLSKLRGERRVLLSHSARHHRTWPASTTLFIATCSTVAATSASPSFLLNKEGMIVKVYQGPVTPERLLEDVKSVPQLQPIAYGGHCPSPERSSRARSSATISLMACPFSSTDIWSRPKPRSSKSSPPSPTIPKPITTWERFTCAETTFRMRANIWSRR